MNKKYGRAVGSNDCNKVDIWKKVEWGQIRFLRRRKKMKQVEIKLGGGRRGKGIQGQKGER